MNTESKGSYIPSSTILSPPQENTSQTTKTMADKLDYIVIQYSNITELVDKVNEKMKEGYVPVGGIAVVPWGSHYSYTQSMILKYK